jgi:hypothetical protein
MSSNTTPESTHPAKLAGSGRRRWAVSVPAVLTAAAALTLLTACGSATPDLSAQVAAVAATSSDPAVIPGTRSAVNVPIPEGATGVTITAIGGGGGGYSSDNQGGSLGAQVSGLIKLSAGDQLIVSVGEEGANIKTANGRALGGWGGLSSTGGNGSPDSQGVGSASGGGATTVQLVQSPTSTVTVLVAGGGGGAAVLALGGPLGAAGGNAGTNVTGSTATGDAGHTEKDGGAAGAAGAAPTSAGTTGTDTDGEYSGGGGGGGGGLVGGTGGSGANNHSGGGGGAGSSMFDPSLLTTGAITVAPSQFSSVNGQVTVAWTMS